MNYTTAYDIGFNQGLESLEPVTAFENRLESLWGESNQNLKQSALQGYMHAQEMLYIMFSDPKKEIKKMKQWRATKKQINHER